MQPSQNSFPQSDKTWWFDDDLVLFLYDFYSLQVDAGANNLNECEKTRLKS